MATSTFYGWAEPDNSSLVKNGASDIRTLGDAIDTSVWNVGFGQAGKNKIINGNFSIWQRGTSSTTNSTFLADRWLNVAGTGGTYTASQQAFTPGTAPVAGYESQYFFRYSSVNVGDARILQSIEDVRTFAGQTVTVSFWAKSATSDALTNIQLSQRFGTGGSAQVDTTSSSFTLTSSWARYSATLSIPSVSGKTIGANSALRLQFTFKTAATFDIDLWGVQVEYGSKMTPFQLAGGGDPQSELAMCQRYYWRTNNPSAYALHGTGLARSTTEGQFLITHPVSMRIAPTSIDFSTIAVTNAIALNSAVTGTALSQASSQTASVYTSGSSGLTADRVYFLANNNSTSGYVGFSAEL